MIKKRIARWTMCLALACAGVVPFSRAEQPAAGQVEQFAHAQELKSKAFEALRAGKFEQTNDYLSKAASLSNDPTLVKMAAWSQQFEGQRKVFAAERRSEYEKAANEVKTILEKVKQNTEVYAMQSAARAHLLAEDKEGFRAEPWVAKLLADARAKAEEFEKQEQWLSALRLYSQLSAIEPENAEWKEKMKGSTKRVRLLMMYTWDEFKKMQDADAKEREEVDALIKPPSTQPAKAATKPAEEKEEDEDGDAGRVDWRDTLRDVRMDMLSDSLINARANYFRDVSYKKMLLGGLQSLRVVLTTPALASEFPGLADKTKRDNLLGFIDAYNSRVENVKERDEGNVMRQLLRDLSQMNKATVELPEEVLVSEFGDGAFAALDPFSSIMWPSEWEEFQKTTTGQFYGVGIQISTDDSGYLKVVSPLEDSPAYRAGIKPDYLVTHIDGKPARHININQAVKKITGRPRTTVTLTIKTPEGDVKDYKLVRDTIRVQSIKGWIHNPGGGWNYFIDPDNKIAYVRMTNFSRTTMDDLSRAVKEMTAQGARGLIFDLRYNPGGLLPVATGVVDKFISSGDIVSTRPDRPDSPNVSPKIEAEKQADDSDVKLIVLVNQYSASASEIVSGALKDHKRAMIIGERTFGKGSVQILYPLGGGQAMMRLTTSHYYLPNGKCIHREENSKEWGVEPDLVVEMTPDQMRVAMGARQKMDILRDKDATPAPAEAEQIKEKAEAVEEAVKKIEGTDPLASDAQLSAALLMMRMQLAGAPL